tara:strand:- start:2643 stop:2840 length:198 start_codon:yes stop_codon:yes gene_type:complete
MSPYTENFEQVIDFYQKTTPTQHQMFLGLISDKLIFFSTTGKESFEIDEDYDISFNGIYHQINIK